jgi:copper homeostasis protein
MLEIACFNADSTLAAARAGADRIELCADYAAGGVTPPIDALERIRAETQIPVNVMIRPRAGDFIYTDAEFQQMKIEIQSFKPEASGFVFGILNKRMEVDKRRNSELVQVAAPLPCTFHRAFDEVPDADRGLEILIECGFMSVLTSGGQPNATAGAGIVDALQKKYGGRISIILGGGVRSSNIDSLRTQTKVEWYHSAAITQSGESVDTQEVERIQELLRES